ncbi:MAG: class I SAM-dependent methyltransferase [Candidatus Diapherotrites archaeon]|nr:class I SAM-dependent methyltransferase [Candidatus Diapherotrites archaeon]
MSKISVDKLMDVSETSLLTAGARYLESLKEDGIIQDKKIIDIFNNLDYTVDPSKISKLTQVAIPVRTQILDTQTQTFLDKNPDGVVVNLGCGLDTRFARIDNGHVSWYDLDLPQVMEIRNNFFKETRRYKPIESNVLDLSWMEKIPKNKPTLFIAEGLLMYIPEKDVKALITNIKENFAGSEMLLEAFSPFLANNKKLHKDFRKRETGFNWGIESGKEINNWFEDNVFVDEWFYFDKYRNKWPIHFRIASIIPKMMRVVKIIHLKF